MGATARVKYLGALRTEAEHLRSGNKMVTDAPVDNNGKGEAFSPTDTVATALATCMLTTMGIKAQSLGFDLEEASAEVVKIMESNPRRISEVVVKLTLRQNCDGPTRKILENTALNCPVAQSLSPDLKQNTSFEWN